MYKSYQITHDLPHWQEFHTSYALSCRLRRVYRRVSRVLMRVRRVLMRSFEAIKWSEFGQNV